MRYARQKDNLRSEGLHTRRNCRSTKLGTLVLVHTEGCGEGGGRAAVCGVWSHRALAYPRAPLKLRPSH